MIYRSFCNVKRFQNALLEGMAAFTRDLLFHLEADFMAQAASAAGSCARETVSVAHILCDLK